MAVYGLPASTMTRLLLVILLLLLPHGSCMTVRRAVRRQPMNLPDLSQSRFPSPPREPYDLVVIGSGPGGESAAVRAAQLGKRVAIIERKSAFGGPTGLSSKAFREAAKRIVRAVDQIGGDRRKQVRGLFRKSFPSIKSEAEAFQCLESRNRLASCGVDLYIATSELISAESTCTTIRVCRPSECVEIQSKHVIIATGSRPHRPETLQNGITLPRSDKIITSTEIGNIRELPNSVAILGGGIVAVEYATVLAFLGIGISLITPEKDFMPFLDSELRDSLIRRMKIGHVLFVNEAVTEIQTGDETEDRLRVVLERRVLPMSSDKTKTRELPERRLSVDMVLYSGGRDANSDGLGLDNVGIQTGRFGRILVTDNCRCMSSNGAPSMSSIYAIGDCIGAGLASIAQQQGRCVVEKLFCSVEKGNLAELNEEDADDMDIEGADSFFSVQYDDATLTTSLFGARDLPLTLWTIPELGSVGLSSVQAHAQASSDRQRSSIVEGYGYFKDMARGRLTGDLDGYVKIVAWLDSGSSHHTIIGVQIFGDGANELIQFGSILIRYKVSLESVSHTPFAAVTLSGLYQLACDDALLKLRQRTH